MPMMTTKGREGATHELKGLEVFEISLVDRPANLKPFLIVKTAEPRMPKGIELTADANGNLSATTKALAESRKSLLKEGLEAATAKIKTLAEALDSDADDVLDRVSSIAAELGSLGKAKPKPKAEAEDAEDEDENEDEFPKGKGKAKKESDFRIAALDSLHGELAGALVEPDPLAITVKADHARLDKMQVQLDSLTKAAHTLTRVVKSTSSGARPAPQAAPTGERPNVVRKESDLWKLDMNSPDIDPDERFV